MRSLRFAAVVILSLTAIAAIAAARSSGPRVDPQAMLAAHNQLRAQHCAPPLAWSRSLAASAERWAEHLRDAGCAFQHSGGPHGENLAAGTVNTLDEGKVVGMWYGEGKKYSYRRGGFSMQTGHFTQVVWRGTREVGCGRARCDGMDLFVCQYDPPGNVEGEYRENVRAPGCK